MRLRVFLALTAAAVLLPGVAHAKGADEVTIESDELAAPIQLSGPEDGESDFAQLLHRSGFFPSIFETEPNPMLATAPTTDLGPELNLTWGMPGPDNTRVTIHQTIYPYAEGGPLTYVEPGQPIFEGMVAPGGWFRAPSSLLTSLSDVGAIDSPDGRPTSAPTNNPNPTPGPGDSWLPSWTPALMVGLVITGLAGVAGFSVRRRAGVAPA